MKFWDKKTFKTISTKYSVAMEPHAKTEVNKILKNHQKNFKTFNPGIMMLLTITLIGLCSLHMEITA